MGPENGMKIAKLPNLSRDVAACEKCCRSMATKCGLKIQEFL